MHWLSLLAMIFVCFSRVGMCMNCDGSIPSYQSGNVIIDNTKRVQEAAAAKQTTFWHKVKDDIPGATYYKIIAVVTNLADCFYGMDENGDLYLTTWWKDNKPETEEERALFFKEDGDFKQMPRETFCECREVPNPVILSGKQRPTTQS